MRINMQIFCWKLTDFNFNVINTKKSSKAIRGRECCKFCFKESKLGVGQGVVRYKKQLVNLKFLVLLFVELVKKLKNNTLKKTSNKKKDYFENLNKIKDIHLNPRSLSCAINILKSALFRRRRHTHHSDYKIERSKNSCTIFLHARTTIHDHIAR